MSQKQTKKPESTISTSNLVDRLWMVLAFTWLLWTNFLWNFDHVRATGMMGYALACAPVGLVFYLVIAPLFRK